MIECIDLSRPYPGGGGVRHINLAIEGGVTCLVGCNGSGKTTLLRLLAGLLKPKGGQVRLDGRDIGGMPARQRAREIALLTQDAALPPQRAVDIVLCGRYPNRGRGIAHSREDIREALLAMEQTGCRALADCRVDRLSGGERQRVRLAAALAQNTPVLLLDEPTTYLDAAFGRELMALLRRLAHRGKTVVMVLHDLQLAMGHADRIAVLEQGLLAGFGDVERLTSRGILQKALGVEIRKIRQDGEEYRIVL